MFEKTVFGGAPKWELWHSWRVTKKLYSGWVTYATWLQELWRRPRYLPSSTYFLWRQNSHWAVQYSCMNYLFGYPIWVSVLLYCLLHFHLLCHRMVQNSVRPNVRFGRTFFWSSAEQFGSVRFGWRQNVRPPPNIFPSKEREISSDLSANKNFREESFLSKFICKVFRIFRKLFLLGFVSICIVGTPF